MAYKSGQTFGGGSGSKPASKPKAAGKSSGSKPASKPKAAGKSSAFSRDSNGKFK